MSGKALSTSDSRMNILNLIKEFDVPLSVSEVGLIFEIMYMNETR